MSVGLESGKRIAALIAAANAKTGGSDANLTAAVGSLMAGFGQGAAPVLTELVATENGEYTPDEGVDGFSKVVANVPGKYTDEQMLKMVERYTGGSEPSRELVEFVVPDGCKRIGAYAFAGCQSLKTVTIPDTVTYIGNNAFSACNKLELSEFPDVVTELGSSSCLDVPLVKLPAALKVIGSSAFAYNTRLAITHIPAGVVSIAKCAFQQTQLTALTFDGTPTSIATDVFKTCSGLTVINVPWAEGAVANAPWGATNATINYNYVEG